jgi:hypothetical protein
MHNPKYLFLNKVKFNIHTFFVIFLMNIQASTPTSSNWISPLCNTPWSTRENIVPRHISCISAAFQFHHLPLLALTLGLWIRILLKAWTSVCIYCVCVVLCIGSDLATGWSPRPRSPTNCVWIRELKKRPRPTRAAEPQKKFNDHFT